MKFYLQIYNPIHCVQWKKVHNIIRQNKKSALQEFLFEKVEYNKLVKQNLNPHLQEMQDKIAALQNQVDSLQQKIIQLEENQTLQIKKPISQLLKRSQASKIDQQYNYTLKPNVGSYFQENDSKVNSEIQEASNLESKSFSEASKRDFKALSHSQQYTIPSNEEKGLHEPNFITLSNLSEDEKIKIRVNEVNRISTSILDPRVIFNLCV